MKEIQIIDQLKTERIKKTEQQICQIVMTMMAMMKKYYCMHFSSRKKLDKRIHNAKINIFDQCVLVTRNK